MKFINKKSAAAVALALSLTLGTAAFAEASDTAAAEEVSGSRDFSSWIGEGADMLHDTLSEGWELVTGTAETGWDLASDAVATGWDIVTDTAAAGWDKTTDAFETGWEYLETHIPVWSEKIEGYMDEHRVEQRVSEAWDTLKEGALHHGEIAMDKLTEAYHTVKDWVTETGGAADQEIAETIDLVAGTAGVEEALRTGWYREVERYMTLKADLVTDAVEESWELIRQNGIEAGSVAEDRLQEAYGTVREWLADAGEPEDSDIMQYLEELEKS